MSESSTLSATIPPNERRSWVRNHCDRAAFCCSLSPQDYVFWTARALDICTGGIRLALSHRFEPGTILAVEMLSSSKTTSHTLQVRVVHATPQEGESWVLGCEFDSRLTDTELQALL